MPKQIVRSGDVRLAVWTAGDPANPPLVLVHGYPDTHVVWDDVVAALADTFRVVTFDNRGAGASDCPVGIEPYRIEQLAADLRAVIDAVSPERPVHLAGHDWGSILAWELVTDPAAVDRIASFTSIAGPCLDHIGHWMRGWTSHPRASAAQLLRSWYVAAFQVPGLGTLPWRLGLGDGWDVLLARVEGVSRRERVRSRGADGEIGVRLYRANVVRRLRHPGERRTDVPVQVVHATGDHFVGPDMASDARRWAPRLWHRSLAATHWAPLTHGPALARMITELADHVRGAPVPALDRLARPGEFGGRLVLVTGAGSGIGRATAHAFAALGAEVVAVDIDADAAARTARAVGGHPFTVDVSDEAAMRKLADEVAAAHGVPDVVVNNAGIGHSGTFLATTVEEWRRVLDVNLWGVIHGCREFGSRMVERGEGGHIVNVASAAAWLPAKDLAAYSTSKAGVAMLSDCLRPEVAAHGVGVSTICPGLIDTNITRTSTFSGLDDAGQQARREHAAAVYGRRNFPPEGVAREIVDAVRRSSAVVAVTPEAKAVRLLARLSPAAVRMVAAGGLDRSGA
ncbi:SDR family oxidoreductase [Pseudonocardia sp.]|uniref:SDR family oxidoreductase n=1 Tax=Pseudonocardia sp. TaxID=60912 RepID=UPI002639B1FE|nr:SDR family oxidoreductase [Pseudonocardia sp.]